MELILKKPDLYVFEHCLEEGVLLLMNDGTYHRVKKYDNKKHRITLEDGREVDLYTFYDSIQFAYFLKTLNNQPTNLAILNHILTAIYNIQTNCKYHAYIDVIEAYLEGDPDHYIYQWCNGCECFGYYLHIEEDTIKTIVNALIEIRKLKEVRKKKNKPYYLLRKDLKLWPKPRQSK